MTRSQPPARQNQHEPMTDNAAISAEERVRRVMRDLNERGPELAPLLPPDLPLTAFLAVANQALRQNPALLSCNYDSLVQAFIKGAYDGLRIDGHEAAIVVQNDKKLGKVAVYMPMVFGLIKQILQSGAALTVKAVVVYKEEVDRGRFKLIEGTTPGIFHEPLLDIDHKTAEKVGVYAIAEVQPGVFKHEWMNKFAVLDVKAESKYGGVWERWPTEMWKKSAIRRLRKSLAGTHKIIDMEAVAMFPQFQNTVHPQLAAPVPARPVRGGGALTDQSGSANGVDMHFGDEREREPVQQQNEQRREQPKQQEQDQGKADIPANPEEWAQWTGWMEKQIAGAPTPKSVEALAKSEAERIKEAPKERRDWINGLITERLADLASESAVSSSQGGGGTQEGQE